MAASMQVRICPASLPPPMASNAIVAPVSASASVSSFMKVGDVESTTCFAPILRRMSACSLLRTMLTSPMPSLMQILFSICPRLDAAAVCTSALWPSRRMVSVMPSAVSGLTNQDAPSADVVPAGKGRHSFTFRQRYCAYIAPPIIATVLPISAFAASDDPVLMTTPAPSLPTGMESSSRAAIARMPASGTLAVMTGCSLEPDAFAVLMSAAPTKSPRSDGLIGVASTRTTTSSGPGSGVGTFNKDISSSPAFLISERSCSPLLPSLITSSRSDFPGNSSASQRFQRRFSRVSGLLAQFLLDPQQLIVFRGAVGARERAGFDLAAVGRHCKVGDGRILGFAGAMRHDGGIARLERELDGGKGLGQGADLVDLDQDGIGAAVFDTVGQPLYVGDEEIVADQLAFAADHVGQLLPTVHIVFRHTVLDRHDRIARDEIGEVSGLLGTRAGLVLAAVNVIAVFEELGRGAVQRQHHVRSSLVAGLADRVHDKLERGIRGRKVRRKAPLVADIGVVAGPLQLAPQRMKNF